MEWEGVSIDYVQEQFEKVYGKSNHYQRIYFGVEPIQILTDKEKEALRNKLQIEENDIVITTIAFADPIKGVDVLLKAIPYIKSNNYKVVIVGINPEISFGRYLHYLAKELEVENSKLKEKIEELVDAIEYYLSISNIYCQPSRSEALGLAACEAKSAHLPVIGSHVGGLPEISDVTFENENPESLAGKINMLIEDLSLRNKIADKSYQNYQQNFDINKGVSLYGKIYHQ